MKRSLPPDWKDKPTSPAKIILALLSVFLALPAVAQNRTVFGGAANAYDFAYGLNGNVQALKVDMPTVSSTGVATLSVAFGTTTLGDGTMITPLSTSAPITVGIGANQETVTPSAVSCTTPTVYQSCKFTATFTNQHGTGDPVSSASYGIDEASLYMSGKFGGGLVLVSPELLKRAGITYTHTAVNAFLITVHSASATVSVLDYSGISGTTTSASHSYNAAAGSVLAPINVIY